VSHAARCAVFALVVAPGIVPAADKVAAVVNGEPLTVAELDAAVAQVPTRSAPLSAAQKRQQRLETLNVLIDDKLVRQFLRQQGPKVEVGEVEKQFAALEAAQKAQGKTLDEYLKETGLTAARVKENFRLMLQLAKYVEAQATDDRLRAYYEANRDLFDKTTVRASHIVLRVAPAAPPAERQQAVAKLRAIRADLGAGKTDFAAAAKAYSQCPSAPQGGDLGYIVRKFQVDEAFARAAFAMKVGEVSDVVEAEDGYHLIWVTDRKPGKASRYEDAAADVRDCFEAELKQNLLTELRKKAKIEIKIRD
jgi:parvulin-like peptidyl-prolyl isomerase